MIRRLRIATGWELSRLVGDATAPWRESASCASVDGELFFPAKGESSDIAKAICWGCPVRQECLVDALEHQEQHGVRGGMSPRERRKLASQRRQEAA